MISAALILVMIFGTKRSLQKRESILRTHDLGDQQSAHVIAVRLSCAKVSLMESFFA